MKTEVELIKQCKSKYIDLTIKIINLINDRDNVDLIIKTKAEEILKMEIDLLSHKSYLNTLLRKQKSLNEDITFYNKLLFSYEQMIKFLKNKK